MSVMNNIKLEDKKLKNIMLQFSNKTLIIIIRKNYKKLFLGAKYDWILLWKL